MNTEALPLFPLNSVLLPGGWLDLRIFETRYLDLVRDCTRHDTGFGIVLLREGSETAVVGAAHEVGCEARIIDFSTLPDGLLGIRVEGRRRFRIRSESVAAHALRVAQIAWCADAAPQPVPAQYAVLVTILERLAEHGDSQISAAAKSSFDDADWVGWRMLERLALDAPEKQVALELDDPLQRLQWIIEQLPRFQAE
ncbi:MAG: LON peptidase substrate-binding domain-containing protein [Xanthomonadales bacterium]|nr:LON peptidase substrate-binding domain-containing protein [Xanthomonadales bacterium]